MSGGRRRRRDHGAEPNHERWMISYADMLTLLLAVFIVLYASAVVNKAKLKAEAASMLQAFQGTPPRVVKMPTQPKGSMNHQPAAVPKPVQAPPVHAPTPVKPVSTQMSPMPPQPQILSEAQQREFHKQIAALLRLRQQLKKLLNPEIAKKEVSIMSTPLSLTIRLNAKVLFNTGAAALTHGALTILQPVGHVLSAIPPGYLVTVQGYTDNKPISTNMFRSNWDLSTARADSVVMLFRTDHVPGNALSAQGFSKYRPIASNKTAVGRSQNRRVEIVITAPKSAEKKADKKPSNAASNTKVPPLVKPLSIVGKGN